MSGDWIKMRVNLWDDPRVGRICDLTGAKEATVIGALYWLWATADQHTENGILPGLSMQQIDRKTGVKGFASALVDVRWLADHPEGVRIVHFEEHNGKSAKKRLETAKRVAKHRAGNDIETPEDQNGNAKSVTGALAREEKSREEQITSEAKASGGKPPSELTKAELWSAGKSLLRQQGMPEAQCGTFVGALVKAHGETDVVDAVRRAVLEQPADAASWLKGALKPKRPNGKHSGFETKDYHAGVTSDGFIA